jgi:hypothetical protein
MEAGFLRGMLFIPEGTKVEGQTPAFEPSAGYVVSSLLTSKSYQPAWRIGGNLPACSVERFRRLSVANQPKEEMR